MTGFLRRQQNPFIFVENEEVRAIRIICILTILLVSAPVLSSARIQDGMLFRSYDVPSEEKTSLMLLGRQKGWITFTDSLSL